MADDEPAFALSIGSVVGGATTQNAAWREAIKHLRSRVTHERLGVVAPLNVNVVFHVPGNLISPDYEGVRTGSWSRKRALIMVQAAVPAEAPDDPSAKLLDLMDAALDDVDRWAARRRVPADIDALRAIVERIRG